MIVWINGAFGSGKTHAAYELQRRLDQAHVFDPEEAGFYIQANLPPNIRKSDFQDYDIWRSFNVAMLEAIVCKYEGTIIVPMTVTDENYHRDLVGELNKHHNLCHITLRAKASTLETRLKKRGDKKNAWSFDQIHRCVKAFEKPLFETYIDTDDRSIDEVVETIGQISGLTLKADNRSPLQKKIDRTKIWMRHMRWLK